MIARREPLAPAHDAVVADQYVVAFGKSGGLGCFTVVEPFEVARGDRVVVQTPRGTELGEVLGPATLRQARLIGAQASGDILRRATEDDQSLIPRLQRQAEALFAAARAAAERLALPLQILDVEVLLDRRHALVQFVGDGDAEVAKLAEALQFQAELQLRFENLAGPSADQADEHSHAGCDKPDCGRTNGAGGCSDCSTGGGCSSCGVGKPDMRAYFAHLRRKMEESHRTPLL